MPKQLELQEGKHMRFLLIALAFIVLRPIAEMLGLVALVTFIFSLFG